MYSVFLESEMKWMNPIIFYAPGSNLGNASDKDTEVTAPPAGGITGITVDKSVEFSYEELAKATDDFSIANKIGQGGFGSVYYAVLRGEVCGTTISIYFLHD